MTDCDVNVRRRPPNESARSSAIGPLTRWPDPAESPMIDAGDMGRGGMPPAVSPAGTVAAAGPPRGRAVRDRARARWLTQTQ